jgi:hypothetical protein
LAFVVYQIDQWDEKVEEFKKKNSTPNKTVDKLAIELDALRDKLVVTKGDNYVGAGEPQLKEKLNDIYETIASYYGAPSTTQLENIASLRKQFESAKTEFEKIKTGNLKAFEKILEKNTTVQKPVIAVFEEFLKL